MARTFSSTWSVTTVPTRSRTQVERLASSSAMRMYTSYRGMRSTGGAAAPSGSTLRKCVLAGTPSLKTLMQLLIGIVVRIASAGALLGEPGVEPRRYQAVGALLALRGLGGEGVGVFVLRVPRVALDPSPLDLVRRRGLDQFLPHTHVRGVHAHGRGAGQALHLCAAAGGYRREGPGPRERAGDRLQR